MIYFRRHPLALNYLLYTCRVTMQVRTTDVVSFSHHICSPNKQQNHATVCVCVRVVHKLSARQINLAIQQML